MELTRKASIAINRVGLINALRFIRYARMRDQLERQAARIDVQSSQRLVPGSLKSVDPVESGGYFRFENSSLEIKFLSPDLVRLSWSPGIPPIPYGIAQTDWPPVHVNLIQEKEGYFLESEELRIRIGAGGNLHFTTPGGSSLREDQPPQRSDMPALSGECFEEGPVWSLRTRLEPESAIFGLGLRAFPLNLQGRSYRMWNSDPPGGYGPGVDPLYLCIPIYLLIHEAGSYLVFFENSYPASFTFPAGNPTEKDSRSGSAEGREAEVTFEGGMLRYYVIPGPPDRAFERYSQLTGRAPLPPRWALGYHQSRWGYKNEADIREVAGGFKEHELPVSAIHLDIDYMRGFRMFTIDEEKFPDLSGLAEDLLRQGIRLVSVLDPCVKVDPGYSLYLEGIEKQAFCRLPDGKVLKALVWPGSSAFPDFTLPNVREWWGLHYSSLLSQGIAGIWHDMNEPSSFAAWGDLTIPVTTLHAMEGRGGTHLEAHNLYGLLMNKTGREALTKIRPDKRPWLLTRSGWAGVARYAWSWTGDTESSWEALHQTISSLLGLSLSGVPYSGSDIGGFLGNPDPELYLRWFQMAVFTPFCRTHSSKETLPREPWRFGEPVVSIVREFLRLRYRLIPYLYTLAWESQEYGRPLMRPLFWPDAKDSRFWEIDDAFFLGDSLLVAPVLEPGAESRMVVLPGGDWFDFWDGSIFHGPAQVKIPVSLERIPILVRAGSLLPLEEGGVLHLHLYPAERGTSRAAIYSDSGDGYGDWRVDRFRLTGFDGGIEIARTEEGSFPFPYRRILVRTHSRQVSQTWVDREELAVDGNVLETSPFNQVRLFWNS